MAMQNVISTADILPLTKLGLDVSFGNFGTYDTEYTQIFKTKETDKREIEIIEQTELQAAGRINENEVYPIGQYGISFQQSIKAFKYGVGTSITEEAARDNLYDELFPQNILKMKKNLIELRELNCMAVLENGFSSAPEYRSVDGKPFFYDSHPLQNGSNSNVYTGQLTQVALQTMIQRCNKMKDYSGQIIKVTPRKLVVGTGNQFVAAELLGGAFKPYTADNTPNTMYGNSYFPEGYMVSHYLNNENFFAMLTDYDDGLMFIRRQGFMTRAQINPTNGNYDSYASERYRAYAGNYRAAVGSLGI